IVILVFLLCPGVSSDIVLTQSGPQIKKPGESATLSCTFSGFTLSGSTYYAGWVRQDPGKPLEWLGSIRGDKAYTYYADSVKGRFTVSVDSSSKSYLEMSSLKTEDTAVYYCALINQLITG
ncbi:HV323 protein, partial [Atractosteus spatula]|nr:HV323 protein [Atractosteus spatula]